MRCKSVQSKLSRYLDGELTPQERGRIRQHLDSCVRCLRTVERFDTVEFFLSQLSAPPDVPEGFADRVLARAATRREEHRVAFPLWTAFSPLMRGAAAALLILGLGLGALMGRDIFQDSSAAASISAAKAEHAAYGFDSLSDAPGGSLADAYLTLASPDSAGGR